MYNNLSQRVKKVRYSKKITDSFWRQAAENHENMVAALKKRDDKLLGQILRSPMQQAGSRIAEQRDRR